MENNFKISWTANNYGGRVGYPIFWFSSDTFDSAPITPTFTINSTPGLMFLIACYTGVLSGASVGEYCLLMMNGYGLKKLYEAGTGATGLNIAQIGITSILSTGTPQKNAFPGVFTLQNCISRTWTLAENVFYYKSFEGVKGSSNEQTRLDNIKEAYKWDNFETDLRAMGATDEGISIIKAHSCLLYVTSNGVSNTDESLLGLLSRSGSGYGITCTNVPSQYVHFNGVSIPGSKLLPQQFYYKTNSYANLYSSPSVCVTRLAIDFCNGEGFKERPLPPCIAGLNPPDLNNSENNIKALGYKNISSEYIKLDSKVSQEVSTALMFGGNLAIPQATKPSGMARFSQLPKKDKILRGIVYEK